MENSREQSAATSESQQHGGHISLASSPGRSNHSSGELKSPATLELQQDAHISLASSPARSNHSSGELKPPTLQQRLEEDSPARSSVSSDRTSLSHGSFPSPNGGGEKKVTASPPQVFPDKHPTSVDELSSRSPPDDTPGGFLDKQAPPVALVNRSVQNEPPALSKKMDPRRGDRRVEEGGGGNGRRSRQSLSILRKTEREQMVKKVALGFRIFGFMFCLVSFSVMAADKNQGWSLDSFQRYKEFRYCMSVNVIGFAYSIAQAFDLIHQLATGKSIVLSRLRCYIDFAIDQMVTYLLISASSSAATRIEDWKSNWGSDKFPDMASAAVSMSFLAFAALASSSLLSGYALCTSKST